MEAGKRSPAVSRSRPSRRKKSIGGPPSWPACSHRTRRSRCASPRRPFDAWRRPAFRTATISFASPMAAAISRRASAPSSKRGNPSGRENDGAAGVIVYSLSVIASSAPPSGRSPRMKRAIRFPYTQAAFRGTNGCSTSPFPFPWVASLAATSLLAMTIRRDRRRLAAGANGGGIKAPSKPFSKLLQNSRVLLQAFPNKSLAVLWDFKGLQGFQTLFDAFQIFRLGPPPFSAFA